MPRVLAERKDGQSRWELSLIGHRALPLRGCHSVTEYFWPKGVFRAGFEGCFGKGMRRGAAACGLQLSAFVQLDVVIVGASVTGSAVATLAREHGLSVGLVDARPRSAVGPRAMTSSTSMVRW